MTEVVPQVHADVAVHPCRTTLGMEGDEVQRRASLFRDRVLTPQTVFKELTQELFGTAISRAGDVRSADARFGQAALQGRSSVVVEAIILRRGSLPVGDVRLVPQL